MRQTEGDTDNGPDPRFLQVHCVCRVDEASQSGVDMHSWTRTRGQAMTRCSSPRNSARPRLPAACVRT